MAATLIVASIGSLQAGCASRTAQSAASDTSQDPELERVRRAVEEALSGNAPRGFASIPPHVRLRSIARGDGDAIVMDFSAELLAGGTGRSLEDALHQVFTAASAALEPRATRTDRYRVLVDGVTLETYLR